MEKFLLILVMLIMSTSCANHKGAIKPNWGLADFNKYNQAYYLSVDQVKNGDSKEVVLREFGENYKVEKINGVHEIWSFNSYRATQFADPVDKVVTVEFKGGMVVSVSEKYQRQINSVTSTAVSPYEKLRNLKKLYDNGVISEEEFETKKIELLEKM